MPEQPQQVQITRFNGGISSFEKIGPEYSATDITLDIFQDPSYMTMPRAATKVSGSTVNELVVWMADGSPYDTNRYFYDLGGEIYRETSAGTWSSLRDVSGAVGEGLEIFDDYLYYAQGTNLGRYGRLSGTPAFNDDLTSWWAAAISDIQTTGGGTGSTDYVPPTSISETATNRQTFTAEHDPIKEITIDVDVVGTGNWTLTVHDSENNSLGSSTIANGSMAVGDNTFTFAAPLRVAIGNSYHFHVTSTVADGGVDTNVNTDLEGAEFVTEYGVLIDVDFHMMTVVEDKLIINNEQYIAVFDQATYEPNKILLDKGFIAYSMAKIDEYVVIGAYKGASLAEAEEAKLFYWDTISDSWNFFTSTTSVGAAHALSSTGNKLRGIYGNRGGLYEGDRPIKSLLNKMSRLNRNHVLEFYPSSISGKENITYIAVSGDSTNGGVSTNIRKGIYAFGAQEESLPDSFVYLYRMSTGNITDNNLKIGFVKVIGSDTYFSHKDSDGNFGVDKVAIDASALSGEASWGSLIFDGEDTKKPFLALKATCQFGELASGETVKVGWREGGNFENNAFTYGDTVSTVGATQASVSIYKRLKEMQFTIIVTSSSGTYPRIYEIALQWVALAQERIV